MKLQEILVPTYVQMLGALSAWLGKAEDEMPEEEVRSLPAARLAPDIDPARPIAHALPQGMVFDLTPEQYVRDWALPQFYFHVMAAYAILRARGVALGKADYVAHMFAYLRPGTLPAQ